MICSCKRTNTTTYHSNVAINNDYGIHLLYLYYITNQQNCEQIKLRVVLKADQDVLKQLLFQAIQLPSEARDHLSDQL